MANMDTDLREIKARQMLDYDDLSRLKNESVMAQDLINGLNIMLESVRFEAETLKKKQGDIRKDLN